MINDPLVDYPRKSEMARARLFTLVTLGVLALVVFLMFVVSVNLGVVLSRGLSALPNIKILEEWRPNESTLILDRLGNTIANIHGDEDRVVIPLENISPNIQRAVMAIEDNRFYEHNGVDVRGTLRAMIQNLRNSDVQGGSTITQQLVKNLFLTPERSLGRKVAEAMLSLRVERYYSKNKILEMYLNQVYWGNHAYGIEKAAQRYFRKTAKELSIAEAALLAGLLKAPEGLSPYQYPKAAIERQREVLMNLKKYGYITQAQYAQALKTPLSFNTQKDKVSKYPYFVAHVIQALNERYGEDVVRRGGLKVYTTLDADAQDAAEKAMATMVKSLPKSSGVNQGALVAIDVRTSQLLALVGGVDFTKSQFNNATQGRRAAGSSFKPFVYLTGFRLGMITPDTMVVDRPVHFNTGYSIWAPKNWDGRYMGPMTVRRALALSRNTTTVQVGMKLGIDEIIKTAKMAGVTSPIEANFSSLLGSSGVSPLEIATAYATFARQGVRMTPTPLLHVLNSRGQRLPLDPPTPQRMFDTAPVNTLTSILLDVVNHGTGVNAKLPNRQVAGKTGTTDNVRDIWFTGYTTDLVACVWMGNQRYVPLKGVFSSNAAKVWHDFAQSYYDTHPIPPQKFDENAHEVAIKTLPIQKSIDQPVVAEEAPVTKKPIIEKPVPTKQKPAEPVVKKPVTAPPAPATDDEAMNLRPPTGEF